MADFSQLARSMVAVADNLSKSLQVTILHWPYSTRDVWNNETAAGSIARKAVMENKQRYVMGANGEMIQTTIKLTFPVQFVMGVFDKFTVPDGTVYPVASFEGPLDSAGNAFITVVYL